MSFSGSILVKEKEITREFEHPFEDEPSRGVMALSVNKLHACA